MKIKELNMKIIEVLGTGGMAVYFGGTENDPQGAVKQAELVNHPMDWFWNDFPLSSEIDWPANTITWICWKARDILDIAGPGIYYSFFSSKAGDFYTSHGRYEDNSQSGDPTVPFANTIGSGSFSNQWFAVNLRYTS
jgi:hypothetical protein